MESKTTELKVTFSDEELEMIRKSLEVRVNELSEELNDSLDGNSTEEVTRLASSIRVAQAARCKIDTNVHA